MEHAFVQADAEGRILAATDVEEYTCEDYVEVELPEDFDSHPLGDYRLVDGALSYTGESTASREEAEKQAQAEAEERKKLDSASREYFLDGGKETMEMDIEDAAASGGGADPQMMAFAMFQIASMDLSSTPCDTVVEFVDLWPDWHPDTAYKHNAPLTYQGRKFRASKDLTSQAIYPPGSAESEYYEVTLAPDGIIVWRQPGGAYDQVYKGEERHYPDASGPVYEALANTTYSPDAYPRHWKKA